MKAGDLYMVFTQLMRVGDGQTMPAISVHSVTIHVELCMFYNQELFCKATVHAVAIHAYFSFLIILFCLPITANI